jgi:hypothetical protein
MVTVSVLLCFRVVCFRAICMYIHVTTRDVTIGFRDLQSRAAPLQISRNMEQGHKSW